MAVGEAVGVEGDDLWVPIHEFFRDSMEVVVAHKYGVRVNNLVLVWCGGLKPTEV